MKVRAELSGDSTKTMAKEGDMAVCAVLENIRKDGNGMIKNVGVMINGKSSPHDMAILMGQAPGRAAESAAKDSTEQAPFFFLLPEEDKKREQRKIKADIIAIAILQAAMIAGVGAKDIESAEKHAADMLGKITEIDVEDKLE